MAEQRYIDWEVIQLRAGRVYRPLLWVGLIYAVFATGNWSLDPALWEPVSRGFASLFAGLGAYITSWLGPTERRRIFR